MINEILDGDILRDGLMLHWKLDSTTGNDLDSGPNNYELVPQNTPTRGIAGQVDGAWSFSAASSEFGLCTDSALLTECDNLTEFTVCFWARATAFLANDPAFCISNANSINNAFAMYPYDNSASDGFEIKWNGTTINEIKGAPLNEWNFFFFRSRSNVDHDAGINGIVRMTTTTNKTIFTPTLQVCVAARHSNNHFNGDVDDVRMWDRALSDEEINAAYLQGKHLQTMPVAHYKLDETSGTTVNDASENANHGVSANVIVNQTGKVGQAYSFNGGSSEIIVPHSPSLVLDGDLTIMAWVYLNNINNSMSFASQTDLGNSIPSSFNFFVEPIGDKLIFGRGNGATETSATNITALTGYVGSWVHLAATQHGEDVLFYINGVADGGGTVERENVHDQGGDVSIGCRTNGSSTLNGLLDDVKIYNRGLSQPEILNYYNQTV